MTGEPERIRELTVWLDGYLWSPHYPRNDDASPPLAIGGGNAHPPRRCTCDNFGVGSRTHVKP